MDTEQLKFLMRAEKTALGILESARGARDRIQRRSVGGRLAALIDELANSLGDSKLAEEFRRLIDVRGEDGTLTEAGIEPAAAALVGWLRGVIESETFEVRLQAEAKALAEARLASERPVGFQKPLDAS